MARDVVQKQIGDCLFDFYPMAPKDALKVMTRLTKLCGESFGKIMGSVGNAKGKVDFKTMEFDESMVTDAVALFVSRLDENEMIDTVLMLLKPVMIKTPADNGTRPILFDRDFSGQIGLLMNVLVECLKDNYSDFFNANSAIGNILRRVPGRMTTVSQT